MADLIKLVRTYRAAPELAERQRLAEKIFGQIEADLRFFVFGSIKREAAKDALQEVLKAVAVSLQNFKGNTTAEFWGWCYRIARNKLNDHFRKQYAERLQSLPPDELLLLVDASAQDAPLSPQDKHDLDHAMRLLKASAPECHDYLWKCFIFGLDYAEIAAEQNLKYDAVRMRIGRCLETAQALVS